MLYIVIAGAVLIALGIWYANRRQAQVTAAVDVREPDVDLSFTPTVEPPPAPTGDQLRKQRDPSLARLSTEELILEVLKECQDPEIPLSIVDLGLVYEVHAAPEGVTVKMTMTAPDCPSHHSITQDVRAKLEEAGFPNPKVDVVWDPPWTAHRISEEGKKRLGI